MFISSRNERCKSLRVRSTIRCAVRWPYLDVLGYCKRHSPLELQCRGTNAMGVRCEVKSELDANYLCEHHVSQAVQCHGLVVSGANTGKRCRSTRSVNRHGFCPYHPARDVDVLRDFARAALRVDAVEAAEATLTSLEKAARMERQTQETEGGEGGYSEPEEEEEDNSDNEEEEEEEYVKEEDVTEEDVKEENVKEDYIKEEGVKEEEDEGPAEKRIKTER